MNPGSTSLTAASFEESEARQQLNSAQPSTSLPPRLFKLLILIPICLVAFSAIILLSAHVFEHVPHSEDEVAYVFQAKVFAENRLAAPTPPYPQAFWTPFVVDHAGQRFGKYPPGWPLLLSLGMRLNVPWLINTFLATLTLALIARLGICFYGPAVGLWAAGLSLVTPGFLFLSSSLLSHPASLFWVTLALVTLFCLFPTPPPICTLLAGFALGAAFATRPFAAIGIGLGLGLFLLALIIRREIKWTGLLWLLVGGLATAALLPLYWWAVTGDPTFNAYLLVWPYDRIGFGPDIGPYGYGLAEAGLNTRLKLTALATGLFGWPGWSSLIFIPLPFLTRRASHWDWLLLSILLSLIGVHVFYWAFGGTDGGFPRYYYDALPSLLLLTARGLQISTTFLARWSLPIPPGRLLSLSWLPAVLVILFTGYNFIWNLPPLLAAQKGKYGITPAQLQAVERANLSAPALVIVKNVDRWSDFAAPFVANSPTLAGPVVYAIDWGPAFNQKLREHFRGRVCWELEGEILRRCP